MSNFLRIANIRKAYKITNESAQKVLNGITIDFQKGELVALLGESGSGKSTLLNIIGCLDNDFSGSVVYKGSYLSDYTEKQMDFYRKKSVGFIFQNYNLIAHMNLLQNVEIAMTVNGVEQSKREQRALDLLKMVGLDDQKNKLPSQLSGGQKQRVAIARALANNPSVILADEPTGALDRESSEIIFNILKEIANMGKLVIIVTHSRSISDKCSRVIEIDEGLVVSDSTNYTNDDVEKHYEQDTPHSLTNKDNFMIAFGNIWRNKVRNLTICIGIAISIISMILILNLSDGMANYVESIYADDYKSYQIEVYASTYSDIEDYVEDIEEIDGVHSVLESQTYTTAEYEETRINYLNINYDDFSPTIIYGTEIENDGEIIVNETFAALIADDSAIAAVGTTITVTYDYYSIDVKVVGIFTSSGEDLVGYVNETDIDCLYPDIDKVNKLYVTVDDLDDISDVMDEITELGLVSTQESSDAQTIIDYIDLGATVLTGVSSCSMVVGAIMIFIVLYISIVERTKEIGVLRAVGCEKNDVRKMFFYEALLLGGISGILGCIICLMLTIVINMATNLTISISFIAYNPIYYIFGILVSVVASSISGISPAIMASQLDPITALRYE